MEWTQVCYRLLNCTQRNWPTGEHVQRSTAEISNEYSKRLVDSSHTYNFWYLYTFILILISYSYYYYSKFKVLIVLILNNTHDAVDFYTPWLNIYKNHKISIIRIRTLQYPVEGLCCFLFSFLSSLYVNGTTKNKTVNFDDRYESFESFMSIISIFRNIFIWMSRRLNQTYFICYEFDANVVFILIATCTYKSML